MFVQNILRIFQKAGIKGNAMLIKQLSDFFFQGLSYDDIQPHSDAYWIRSFMAKCCSGGLGWTSRRRRPGSSIAGVY